MPWGGFDKYSLSSYVFSNLSPCQIRSARLSCKNPGGRSGPREAAVQTDNVRVDHTHSVASHCSPGTFTAVIRTKVQIWEIQSKFSFRAVIKAAARMGRHV